MHNLSILPVLAFTLLANGTPLSPRDDNTMYFPKLHYRQDNSTSLNSTSSTPANSSSTTNCLITPSMPGPDQAPIQLLNITGTGWSGNIMSLSDAISTKCGKAPDPNHWTLNAGSQPGDLTANGQLQIEDQIQTIACMTNAVREVSGNATAACDLNI